MKSHATSTILLSLLASSLSLAENAPKVNPDDPRYKSWKPAGPNDIRSACPGLNSLANHGFLPHDGANITAVSVIRAAFEGFGMSPEVPAIIVLKGLEDAKLPLDATFTLHDADRKSWEIEHTRSLSRDDVTPPSGDELPPKAASLFQKRPWDVALATMKKCSFLGHVSVRCIGKARAARVIDGANRPPKAAYDRASAAHGAVEAARVMLTLGNKAGAKLKYLRSIFEKEKFPHDLGWRPTPYSGDISSMLESAAKTQKADKVLRCTTNGTVATRFDVIELFESSRPGFIVDVKKFLKKAGFENKSIFEELDKVEKEKKDGPKKSKKSDSDSECKDEKDDKGKKGKKGEKGKNYPKSSP
ncbi:hypothetical protein CDD83_4517 [Cordyceps sp. RAO-2017]|nr:hypothetical protein CDD83_4517 [Cordyceps sp. RAO-2017]